MIGSRHLRGANKLLYFQLLKVDFQMPWDLREMANTARKRALSGLAQRVAD